MPCKVNELRDGSSGVTGLKAESFRKGRILTSFREDRVSLLFVLVTSLYPGVFNPAERGTNEASRFHIIAISLQASWAAPSRTFQMAHGPNKFLRSC